MSDGHISIPDLAEFTKGRLGEEDGDRVEAHLQSCERCRDESVRIRELDLLIREEGPRLFESHPDDLALRAHALGVSATDPALLDHLSICVACSLGAQGWRDLAAAARPPAGRGVGPSRRLLWAAAGVVLGVALTAGAASYFGGQQSSTASWSGGPSVQIVLPGPVRGEEPGAEVVVSPEDPFLVLGLQPVLPDGAADSEIQRLEIRNATGRVVWSTTVGVGRVRDEMARLGSITFVVPAGRLGAGKFDLTLGSDGTPAYRASLVIRHGDPPPGPAPTATPRD